MTDSPALDSYPADTKSRHGLAWLLWGDVTGPSTYYLSRRLFLRLLGLVYLIAFVSLGVQVSGLIGQRGILPVESVLRAVYENVGADGYWKLPTLCWLSASDVFLHFQCVAGALLSLLLIAGVAPMPALFLLWVLYLSLVKAGQAFLSFQWDILLLETGFLTIFFAPRSWLPDPKHESPPSRVFLFLLRWLLFRLMLLSGLVKFWSQDGTWTPLTALNFHYYTQPLPAWTSWYTHQWPEWLQKSCVVIMFVIELAVPFLIFAPRRLRHFAGVVFVAFMLVIAATGNYNFFNLLGIALCVLLLDDALLLACARITRARIARARILFRTGPLAGILSRIRREDSPDRRWPGLIGVLFAILIVPWSLIVADQRLRRCPGWARISGGSRTWFQQEHPEATKRVANIIGQIDAWTGPFDLVNAYGLFQSMTTARPEIIIEGSNDGKEWLAYEFRWKPGDLTRPPRFAQPHQPRLDWQMWFAALQGYQRTHWFRPLLQRLLEGSPEVLNLLAKNGSAAQQAFPDRPPRYIRAIVYQYHFTDREAHRATGQWWTRENARPYSPVFQKRD